MPSRADEVAVLVGRFAPLHRGHLQVLQAALASYRLVVVVLGSAFQAATPRNPFTWQQRAEMVALCLTDDDRSRVRFVPARDHHRDEHWAEEVARGVVLHADGAGHRQITVVNPEPATTDDVSMDWQKMFPRWGRQPLGRQSSGTDGDTLSLPEDAIRAVLFSVEGEAKRAALAFLKQSVPDQVRHYLSAWWETPLRARLAEETAWIGRYRKQWPAEQAMTTDAVVTCSNHVLLIERSEGAGAGLFAVPGGFLEKHERFYDAAKRELREETGLGFIGDNLDVAFVRAEVFDRPDRSLRARIVTVAHLFDLGDAALPDVQGGDDARQALWVPIPELVAMEGRFFEDHFQILNYFLGLTVHTAPPSRAL